MSIRKSYMKLIWFTLFLISVSAVSTGFEGGNGSFSNPYQISTCDQLQNMSEDLDANYKIVNDIDCSETSEWNNGKGFQPIGKSEMNRFEGKLNGSYHVIRGLYINRSGMNVGLFGYTRSRVEYQPDRFLTPGKIKNLGLIGVNITGGENLGAIAGYNGGVISKTFVKGEIKGETKVGGLVGVNNGKINISYSKADIISNDIIGAVGGLAGVNYGGKIKDTYFTGNLTIDGDSVIRNEEGGITSYSRAGEITDSYFDKGSLEDNIKGIGKSLSTSKMKGERAKQNMNLDFSEKWKAQEKNYPLLANFKFKEQTVQRSDNQNEEEIKDNQEQSEKGFFSSIISSITNLI